jgi:transcriptional regulator with XRE-family HTH domain
VIGLREMREKYMPFGDFIRKKRLDHPSELQAIDVAECLGISISYMSQVENRRKKPFEKKILVKLAECLDLSEEDTALMYDLASRDNGEVPHDISDTFMYEEIGDLARYALRQSKAGYIEEEDWKDLIRKGEIKKAQRQNGGKGGGRK